MKNLVLLVLIAILSACAGPKRTDSKEAPQDSEQSRVSQDELRTSIRSRTSDFRICHEAYSKKLGRVGKSGKFNFKWNIEPDGKAADVKCELNTFEDQEFEECMADIINSIEYPKKDYRTNVEFPFIFKGNF